MVILALESSCDETSAAIVRDDTILATVVSSQIKLHSEYGGVVPELATREHLRNLTPVVQETLHAAGIQQADITAIAATQGPGLPNALMIGCRAAQSMAWSLDVPFIGINHHEAHLYSPWIEGQLPKGRFDLFQPNISLIVSGGHTMLVDVEGELRHKVLGGTVDDAAGECFDKVAKLIGLPYPGGPELDALAGKGNPKAFNFPRPMLREEHDDFSFSGLKTSVRYFLRDNPNVTASEADLRDLCASVQAAIVDVLVAKTVRAAERMGRRCVTASGGVTCNSGLRSQLTQACDAKGLLLRMAEKQLCTDNAGMVGVLAGRKLLQGDTRTGVDAEILPADVLA